jgi:hypothetical protein
MKYTLLLLLFLPMITLAEPGDRGHFIEAWEAIQKNSALVESFDKVDDGEYLIKFKHIPYEGPLVLLTADVENNPPYGMATQFTKTGFVEIDLPGAMDNILQKYSRSFHKWAQHNTLHFDATRNLWVDQEAFTAAFMEDKDAFDGGVAFSILEYWDYILAAILFYFLWSAVISNKRTKSALKLQEEAFKKSIELSETSIQLQTQALDAGRTAHEKTNHLLAELLAEIKAK